jgi:nitrogen regulatory protein P-II 1
MKMILAFIPPYRLDDVRRGLERLPHFPGMTVTDGRGFGREKMEPGGAGERRPLVEYTGTTRIEVVTHDDQIESILRAIAEIAHTGRPGDGKIFVLPVEQAIRIRSLEEGEAAV